MSSRVWLFVVRCGVMVMLFDFDGLCGIMLSLIGVGGVGWL